MNFSSEISELSRYIIGIDLGTTNSAVAFVDTTRKPFTVEDFRVAQVSAPSEVSSLSLFPSCHYEAASGEFSSGAIRLPWHTETEPETVVGVFARDHGAQIPGRLVVSAKSWLSHSGVDRTAPLLPWHALPDVEKLSPVEITTRYLKHMKDAWNFDHPEHLMENQDVVITVPASFDEIARELTVTAAAQAGLPKIVLLEEPQAAFYAWIQQHAKNWQSFVNAGQKILICDIGGGTTDFTLIQVRSGENGAVQFHRIAVGDHLILGGDNLDLALAYHVEQNQLSGRKLTPRQFGALVRNCQRAKEVILGSDAPENITLTIPGTGASLIGGGIQVEISNKEVHQVLIDGFFPFVHLNEQPSKRQSGFQEFGLPYAPDPAITKYLASFLTAHRKSALQFANQTEADSARPDIVLFNGGVLGSSTIRKRILDVLQQWFSTDSAQWKPIVFENDHPELAVARGASYFGLVRRGGGVRIAAGLARSYYIGVETGANEIQALCLAPSGLQEGQTVDLQARTFDLLIRQPVEFPLYVSSKRTTDNSGDLVAIDPLEMFSLPPIRTVLRSGKKMEADIVKVNLHVKLTEIGTLDLWCTESEGNRSWKLQFDVRSATRTDVQAHKGTGEQAGFLDTETIQGCKDIIVKTFTTANDLLKPQELMKNLELKTGIERNSWPPSLLRFFWEVLMDNENTRARDPVYEVRWLNFLGFALRPGYGFAVDDWRVKQTWQLYQKGVIHPRNQACMAEWWILWRRVAGGLVAGQQKALAQPLIASIRSWFSGENEPKRKTKVKSDGKFGIHELTEIWRLLASLEYLPSDTKIELGSIALKLISRKDTLSEAAVWALGRLGARVPLYGPLNELIDVTIIMQWIKELMSISQKSNTLFLSLMQLCRNTQDRYRDIDTDLRQDVLSFMKAQNAPAHLIELIESGGKLDEEEQSEVFGEKLPRGLRLL